MPNINKAVLYKYNSTYTMLDSIRVISHILYTPLHLYGLLLINQTRIYYFVIFTFLNCFSSELYCFKIISNYWMYTKFWIKFILNIKSYICFAKLSMQVSDAYSSRNIFWKKMLLTHERSYGPFMVSCKYTDIVGKAY